MSVHYKTGGVWKDITDLSGKASGTWKDITDGWVKVAGVWKRFYGSDGYSFNLTAGDGPSSLYQGYSDGTLVGAIGSIDAEPISGHALISLLDAVAPSIVFEGDCTSELSGKTVWVDSTEYTFDGADWAYDSEEDYTIGDWNSNQPDFTASSEYFVEIK